MVAEALDIARESYLAILMDRHVSGPILIGSRHGGMDIEEVAEKDPDAIFKVCSRIAWNVKGFWLSAEILSH